VRGVHNGVSFLFMPEMERRDASRHIFSATAEVVETSSGACVPARAADLSQKGCYLDMLNPFSTGTKVGVRVLWDGTELTCAAEVRDSHPGMGMGIAFTDLDDSQTTLIKTWIEKLASPPAANLSGSVHSENTAPRKHPDEQEALAVRLIDLLHRKGLLTSNDVAALLRERVL
jgi:hypothetical protein